MRCVGIVHSVSMLTEHAAVLASADMVVCGASMDVALVRRAAPHANVFADFNCVALFGGGPNSEFWNGVRSVMERHVYTPRLADRGYENDPLIKPTVAAAMDYGRLIGRRVADGGFDGWMADQSWYSKPQRFVDMEWPHYFTGATDMGWARDRVRWAWKAYLRLLFDVARSHSPLGRATILTNCSCDPLPGLEDAIVMAEHQQGSDLTGSLVSLAGALDGRIGVLWYGGVEVAGRNAIIADGVLLGDTGGAEPTEA